MAERRSPKPGKPGKPSFQKPSGGPTGNRSRAGKSSFSASGESRKPSGFRPKRDFNDPPRERGGFKPERFERRDEGTDKRPRRSFDKKPERGEGWKPAVNRETPGFEKKFSGRKQDDQNRPRRSEGFSDQRKPKEGQFSSSRPAYGKMEGFRPDRKREDGYLKKLKEEGKSKSTVFSAVSQNWSKPARPGQGRPPGNSRFKPGQKTRFEPEKEETNGMIRLNRYIANAGICSRRDADQLIADGMIVVNGKTVTEMGYQVKPTDVVKYGKRIISREKLVYILMNKPKNFITTMDDPEQRRTVIDIIKPSVPERVYPVGRLDRNTTGLLLMTNDGELAEKLSHPSHKVKKVYEVSLNRPITQNDFDAIRMGVELEDGKAYVDAIEVVSADKQTLGLEIHSGRNRIVRRIFEHLNYEVTKLDRVMYAGLTKKNLTRGQWRFLTEQEVINLKYLS